VDGCKQACCDFDWCVSFDYDKPWSQCHLSRTSKDQVPLKAYSDNRYDHYALTRVPDMGEPECRPFTEEQCRRAAHNDGYKLGGHGHPFVGRWGHKPKGCYVYKSGTYSEIAFFNAIGQGNGENRISRSCSNAILGDCESSGDSHRVPGFNCCAPRPGEAACKQAAEDNGLTWGGSDNWGHMPKGCYTYYSGHGTYKHKAYYNRGGYGAWDEPIEHKYVHRLAYFRPECTTRAVEGSDCGPWRHFANAAISGHNTQSLTGVTVEDCMERCCENDWCKSFDYTKGTSKCDLSNMSADEVGGLKRDYSGNPYDHYELTPESATEEESFEFALASRNEELKKMNKLLREELTQLTNN